MRIGPAPASTRASHASGRWTGRLGTSRRVQVPSCRSPWSAARRAAVGPARSCAARSAPGACPSHPVRRRWARSTATAPSHSIGTGSVPGHVRAAEPCGGREPGGGAVACADRRRSRRRAARLPAAKTPGADVRSRPSTARRARPRVHRQLGAPGELVVGDPVAGEARPCRTRAGASRSWRDRSARRPRLAAVRRSG